MKKTFFLNVLCSTDKARLFSLVDPWAFFQKHLQMGGAGKKGTYFPTPEEEVKN